MFSGLSTTASDSLSRLVKWLVTTCQDSHGNGARPSKIPLKRNPKLKSLVNIFNIFTGLRIFSSISAGEAVAVPQVWTSPAVRCRCRRESGPPALGCSGWDWDHHASAQIERRDDRTTGDVERWHGTGWHVQGDDWRLDTERSLFHMKQMLHSAPCPVFTLKNTGRSHDRSRHSHHFCAFKTFDRAIIVKVYVVVHHSPRPSCMIFLYKSHDHVNAQVFGGTTVRMRMIVLTIHQSKLCPSNRIRGWRLLAKRSSWSSLRVRNFGQRIKS